MFRIPLPLNVKVPIEGQRVDHPAGMLDSHPTGLSPGWGEAFLGGPCWNEREPSFRHGPTTSGRCFSWPWTGFQTGPTPPRGQRPIQNLFKESRSVGYDRG